MMVATEKRETRRRVLRSSLAKVGTFVTLVGALVLVLGCPVVTPPVVPACMSDADCTTDALPVCDTTDEVCVACLTDADCANADFCDGDETCSDTNTCVAGTNPCTGDETCNETTNRCETACTSDDDCTAPTALCETVSGVCVACLDDADCVNGDFCDGDETCGDDNACVAGTSPCTGDQTCDEAADVCEDAPTEFAVSISGCPTGNSDGNDIALSAAAVNASDGGRVTFAWSAPGGGFDDDTADSVVFNTSTSTTVTVTAQDNTVTAATEAEVSNTACTTNDECDALVAGDVCNTDLLCETPATDEVVSAVGDPVTDTCDVTVVIEANLTVSAGADRAFPAGGQGVATPPLSDFPGAYPGAGATLRAEFGSGAPTPPGGVAHAVGRIYKDLSATASDPNFDNNQLTFLWACDTAPDPATCSNITLLDPTSVSTGFLVSSVPTGSLLTLKTDGLTTTLPNVVVPGRYVFRVTVANPNGDTSSGTVGWTITPGFAIPTAAGGSLEGMTLANGQVTNRVMRPNSINVPMTALVRSAGTIRFLLTDTSGAADALTPSALNEVSVTPASPPATTSFEAMVTSPNRGSFTVNAQFESGEATVPSAASGLTVRVQNAISGAIDTNASSANSSRSHFGAVNSTNLATVAQNAFHGARTTDFTVDGLNDFWDGEVIIQCDVNGDGFPEVITADGNVLSFMRGNSTDPGTSTNSPFANVLNNAGTLTETNAGTTGTLDSFPLSGANMTGSAAAVVQITSLCCGDFDGDGNVDLAVGEGGFDGTAGGAGGREGRILVFYGQGNNGFAQNPYTTNGNTVFSGALMAQPKIIARTDDLAVTATDIDTDDQLGHSLICCDVNNDGFDDIIAGAPGGGQTVTLSTGVLENGGASTGTTITVDTVDATTIFEPGDVVVVDANDDTAGAVIRRVISVTTTTITVDKAIAATLTDNETVDEIVGATGAVFGILGNTIRLPNSTIITDTGTGASFRIIPASSISGDLIGASLACCDVNADGTDDIVFGAPGRKDSATATRVAAGGVFVTFGRTAGLSGNINTVDRIFEGNTAGLGFGRQLACCNWNGSGGDDLVVSAGVGTNLSTTGTGRLYFIDAATGNIQSAANGTSTLTDVPVISGGQTDTDLGTCLACWEFSGDANWDLLAAGASATPANQVVLLINGSSTLSTTVTATSTFTDSDTTHTLLTTLVGINLWPGVDEPFDVDGALFNQDGCGFADVNGDKIRDLIFQGDTADGDNVSNTYAVMGAE